MKEKKVKIESKLWNCTMPYNLFSSTLPSCSLPMFVKNISTVHCDCLWHVCVHHPAKRKPCHAVWSYMILFAYLEIKAYWVQWDALPCTYVLGINLDICAESLSLLPAATNFVLGLFKVTEPRRKYQRHHCIVCHHSIGIYFWVPLPAPAGERHNMTDKLGNHSLNFKRESQNPEL